MSKTNTRFKILLFFFIFSIGLIASFVTIDIFYFSNQLKKTLIKNAVEKIEEREEYLSSYFESTQKKLKSIRKSKYFRSYLSNKLIYQDDVKDMFRIIARNDKNIMQFRYIDVNGFERIRVDRKELGSEVLLVKDEILQNKSSRYYFKDSKNKNLEQVWFSNLDVNIENGKVEKPYKPVLRAILPVKNNNQFDGIIIINYFMKNILTKLAKTPFYDLVLANDKGFPLIHYNNAYSWGYYKKEPYSIKNCFPQDYNKIITHKNMESSTLVSKRLNIPTPEKLIMILQLKKTYLAKQKIEKLNEYALISFIIFILAVIMSLFFSKFIQNILDHLTNTKRSNKRLKHRVKQKNIELQLTNDELKELNENLELRVQKEIEKNNEKEKQLFAQSKMAAMGEMIGNIAHQWRQPLSVISTIASGIKMQYKFDQLKIETLPSQMGEIVDRTQYLSQTIDTFRNFLKEKKEFQEIILQESIHDSLEIVGTTLKNHQIKIQKNFDDENPIKIFTISSELIQVIINILNNSKDVLIEKNVDNAWVKIELIEDGQHTTLTIEDNGGGVPEDIILRIFEPYFTTKHKSQGTGLGLHMSYNIVTESLNGEIYVQNSENGAKFFIILPLNKKINE